MKLNRSGNTCNPKVRWSGKITSNMDAVGDDDDDDDAMICLGRGMGSRDLRIYASVYTRSTPSKILLLLPNELMRYNKSCTLQKHLYGPVIRHDLGNFVIRSWVSHSHQQARCVLLRII